jgi:hypothetical protein
MSALLLHADPSQINFQSMRFSFASIMIILLTITLGLVSFNIAVAVREPLKLEKIWTLKSCWARVARDFVMFFGIVLLIHSYVPSSNSTAVFSILMMSMMLIPLFSFYSWMEKRRRILRILFGGGVFLSVVEMVPHLGDVVGIMTPTHPFSVIPVFSLFLVSISCTVGELGVFVSHPVKLSQKGAIAYMLVAAMLVTLAYITWTLTHAAIAVWI